MGRPTAGGVGKPLRSGYRPVGEISAVRTRARSPSRYHTQTIMDSTPALGKVVFQSSIYFHKEIYMYVFRKVQRSLCLVPFESSDLKEQDCGSARVGVCGSVCEALGLQLCGTSSAVSYFHFFSFPLPLAKLKYQCVCVCVCVFVCVYVGVCGYNISDSSLCDGVSPASGL